VTLILRPPGRGNWTPVVLTVQQSRHAPRPLDFYVWQIVDIGGQRLRVVAVLE
jgi:hypothetical protein